MILNYIWMAFFIFGFIISTIRVGIYFVAQNLQVEAGIGWLQKILDFGSITVFTEIIDNTYKMSELSIKICIGLAGIMALWTGIMGLAEKSGLVQRLSILVNPVLSSLFPTIPKNHPVFGTMMMNFSANMLGLDNAATPLGIQAMSELQLLNKEKERASNAQIMFLMLNTSGLTLIPISVMAIRSELGATNPTEVFLPILAVTFCSTLAGIVVTSLIQRINLFKPGLIFFISLSTLSIACLIYLLTQLPKDTISVGVSFIGNFILFSIIVLIFYTSFKKKIASYDVFIKGAKEGLMITLKIAPYLIAILVGIGIFRTSGGMNLIAEIFTFIIELFQLPSNFVDALPVGLMKPLSGSGSRAIMVDVMNTHGVDSFPSFVASLMQGSTETTFYVLAVYFGAVNIRYTRYAVGVGLVADLVGLIASIVFAYLFFY